MAFLTELPLLSLMWLAPAAGMLLILLTPSGQGRAMQSLAVLAALLPLLFAAFLYAAFNQQQGGGAYTEQYTWIEIPLPFASTVGQVYSEAKLSFSYTVAVDGLSLPLLLAAALVTGLAAVTAVQLRKRRKAFYFWLLWLEASLLGLFIARDVLLFIVFLQAALIALYFLLGIWGNPDGERTANRLLAGAGLGSVLLLVVFLILTCTAGLRIEKAGEQLHAVYSGSYGGIARGLLAGETAMSQEVPDGRAAAAAPLSEGVKMALFILQLIGFGLFMPLLPFHTWLMKAQASAPIPVAMIISGLLPAAGSYGLLRYGVFLFPEQAEKMASALAVLGIIQLLYGALLALRQTDMRQLLAYASLSQMGLIWLGIAAFNETGLQGTIFQLMAGSLCFALLWLVVGSLQERAKTTAISELGGLARSLPFICGIFMAAGLSIIGIPGLAGFPGILLSLLGLFDSLPWLAAAAIPGIVLTAAYMLRGLLSVSFGPIDERHAAFKDARLIEAAPMIILLAFIVLLGCFPSFLTDTVQQSITGLYSQLLAGRMEG
ncbi:NADH-quinone oxidoreductase subunit M [Paenibacillus sp. BIHB 4019]|uniref:NADH-quinone oxidoreductase subunit M n=1 Tax=Paenibacillus sp. BIHB 4019 TaxID=1870819 RepID=A0A1B2DGT6_9BACL|nr:NADH-quinone oxidoreductase subunit M [Paenibacillus sp. BIHB 4019]ANY66923.1 NADH-quinone oxidoreductase subunit M [Paenibacillus sp. BIHB 4019]